jgi:hypothetical protein
MVICVLPQQPNVVYSHPQLEPEWSFLAMFEEPQHPYWVLEHGQLDPAESAFCWLELAQQPYVPQVLT